MDEKDNAILDYAPDEDIPEPPQRDKGRER
jgi:hypothetical protein